MSDRPGAPQTAADPGNGGWRKPEQPGDWRTPRPSVEDDAGWRAPQRLAPVDVQEGWRVLKSSDSETIAEPPPTEASTDVDSSPIPHDDSPAQDAQVERTPAEAVEDTVLPYDDKPSPLATPVSTDAKAEAAVETAQPEVIPFGDAAEPVAKTETNTLAEELAELTAEEPAAQLDALDDDDDDSFSMSELVALASLVDEQPRARSMVNAEPQKSTAPETPVDPDDPAEVARRNLAALMARAGSTAPPDAFGTPAPSAPPPEESSADIARRMAAQLGGGMPVSPPPAPASDFPSVSFTSPAAQPPLSPADQELLNKYRTAENAIRSLRERYKIGQLSRDQMQAELRQHMVLDENNVWWMLGIESESWYRFEDGQWVTATPRVIEQSSTPSVTSTPSSGLPYLPDDPQSQATARVGGIQEGATVRTVPIQPGMESMPLPKAVPIRDPEATVAGVPGIYLGDNAGDAGFASQATIANPAIPPAPSVISTPSPMQVGVADTPPNYDLSSSSPTYEKAKARQQQSLVRTLLILAAVGVAGIIALSACGLIAGVLYYQSLAAPWEQAVANLANYQPQFRTARILAADGSVIAELTSQQGGARDTIALSEISPYLIHAVISTENERYYSDPGWDAFAIARAFVQNVVSGDIESGASTLTQQLARSLILQDTSLTADRKLQEIVIASMIARTYDKNFILQLYMNEFFFGNQSYGVEAASRFYFNKSAADLNMPEAAMLAGLLQAPAAYDPVVNRNAAFDRMVFVLNRMADVGCIQFQHAPYLNQPFCVTRSSGGPSDITSPEVTLQKAIIESAQYEPRRFQVRYPHFVNYIQQIVEDAYGSDAMFRGGFEIRTTLVPRIQDVAQDALFRQVQQLLNNGVQTGAVMVTDPRDGSILAMIGSPDFNNVQFQGQNNFAFLPQQPGSSLKPIVYTAALEGTVGADGQRVYMTPSTIIWDVPTTYGTNPPYSPVNFDRQFHGPVSVRYALQNSYNVPAVKAYAFIGADRFRDVATRMGLEFLPTASFGLPTALGADEVRLYDMMEAYGTLANDGLRNSLRTILQITDFQGNQIALPAQEGSTQAIAPALAYLMQSILSDNQARAEEFGLNSGLTLPGFPDGVIAAKTGTSNENRDLWTMGFTNNAVVGVWVGRLDNNPTTGSTQTAAVPIWNVVMRAALEGRTPEAFGNPGGVIQAQICSETGTLFDPNVNPNCSVRAELFLEAQPPPSANTSFVQTIQVDTWSLLRATTACPEYVETRTFANIDDPFAVQWLNSPQGQAFAQQLGLPVPLEPVPVGECPANQQPNVRITSPTDGQQVSGTVNITGIVNAPDFNRFQLELAPLAQPDQFAIISPVYTTQQPNNTTVLQWNTSTVPNGIYRLRLAAFANNGGYIYKIVQIGVNNMIVPTVPVLPTSSFPTPIDATPIPAAVQPVQPTVPVAQATIPPAQGQVLLPPTATTGVIPLGGLMPLATPGS